VDRIWKIFSIIGAIAGFVFGLGLIAAKYRDVPNRVSTIEVSVDSIHKRLDRVEQTQQRQVCLAIAERLKGPWQTCFQK
jgi:hypothetical protein